MGFLFKLFFLKGFLFLNPLFLKLFFKPSFFKLFLFWGGFDLFLFANPNCFRFLIFEFFGGV